ncbi:hypothetical protein Gpo141_00003101 [Globisporangium polare]
MSTDALALAQLELLYRLGVLEREQPTSSAFTASSSSRRHRQPTPTAAYVRADPNGSSDEELGITTAVRPHALTTKQLDDDAAEYDNYDNTRAPLHSTSRARAYGSVHTSPPRHRESPRQRLRQPVKTTTAEQPRKKPREQARMWFLYWKLFVRNAREKSNVRAIWRFHVKKRVVRRWRCEVQYQKRLVMQTEMLHDWTATRTT